MSKNNPLISNSELEVLKGDGHPRLSDLIRWMNKEDCPLSFIGIAGVSGSGKDTLFRYMNRKTDKCLNHIKFSDKLKHVVKELFDLDSNLVYAEDIVGRELREVPISKFGGRSVRNILQEFGVFIRGICEDVWVNKAMDYIGEDNINVFTDVRFLNEAEAIKRRNGKLIYVSSQLGSRMEDWVEAEKSLESGSHISESGVSELASMADIVVFQSEINKMKRELYGV